MVSLPIGDTSALLLTRMHNTERLPTMLTRPGTLGAGSREQIAYCLNLNLSIKFEIFPAKIDYRPIRET